ncbi:MAG: site-specific integrase [Gammaproteobacteria bacterium]
MPYKRKDSDVWWVSYVDGSGKRVRRSTETTDRKEAKALEAKWKLEAHKVRLWDEQPSRTYDELMVAYLKATTEKRSHQRNIDAARHLTEFYRGRELNKLKAVDIRAYCSQRQSEVSNATINRELCLLSSAINYARSEWDWDIPNPVTGRKLREPEGRTRRLTPAEAQSLLAAADAEVNAPHLGDFLRLALHTGCRKQELLGLEWSRVDMERSIFYLDARHTKTQRRRSIPLNAVARAVMEQRRAFRKANCPDSPWVLSHANGDRIKDVKRSFTTACRRAGIEDFRIHDLRHTCGSWLVSAGAALSEVKDLLGHTTVRMTERYAHLAPENVRAAVSMLENVASRSGHVEIGERSGEL